jgi:hypothetical protein
VATGKEKRGNSGSSKSGSGSESPSLALVFLKITARLQQIQYSLLTLVDLDVPLAPDLGRGEHATGSAHVTEGSLTGTVSTTTRDARNTGNSAT